MSGLVAAVMLLTVVPVPRTDRARGADATPWIPVVGAGIGLLAGVSYASLSVVLPPLAAAAATMAGVVVLTGALHEDGLADTADALGARTKRRALEILDDPRHGSYGVLALVVGVIVRISTLAVLSPSAALVAMPVVHSASRATAVVLLATTPPARQRGLAARAHATLTPRSAWAGVAAVAPLAVALTGAWAIGATTVVAAVSWAARRAALKGLGGITGDVLGAAQQLAEMALLVMFAIGLAISPA